MNYEIGLIFIDDEDYSNKAKWCNENGCYIEEIEPNENGEKQFQIKEIVVPILTLDELKQEKHAQLKLIMQVKRNTLTCHYDGDEFDCNTDAQNNINSLILFTETSKTDAIVRIRSSNETTHVFNKEQLHELSSLMVKAVNDLYTEYWVLKDNLSKAKCEEDIKSINWS